MTHRKDGLWQEQVKVNGKTKYFYGHTKAEVLRKISEYREEQVKGPLLTEAIDQWLEAKEKTVGYRALEGYNAPIKRIKAAFPDARLLDITPAQIKAFIEGIAKSGFKRTVVQRPLDILRGIFDYAVTDMDVPLKVNPCAAVRLPGGLKQAHRELADAKDIQRVKASVGLDFGLYAYLIMFTGLRDGEALALTDKDFSDTEISISKSISWQPNQPIIKSPKTEAGVRSVPLLDPLRAVLPEWTGYLFSANGGLSPLTQIQFRHRWYGYCRAAGLSDAHTETHKSKGKNNREYVSTKWTPRIVPYQLRHEFATLCFDAEMLPKDLQDLMGHASPETAQRIYAHIRESRREKTSQKLNEYVKNM